MSRTLRGVELVYVPLQEAEAAFKLLTEQLALPVAWPYMVGPDFASGGVNLGYVNLEVTTPSDVIPGLRDGEPGIAFHPVSTPELIAELDRREVAHGPPEVSPPGASVGDDAMWTTTFLDAVSIGPTNVYACEYHLPGAHDYEARQRALDEAGGGKLGLLGVQEIVLTSSDLTTALEWWQRLLDPAPQVTPGVWRFEHGPALRLVATASGAGVELALRVRSIEDARGSLEDLLRVIGGLRVRLLDGDAGR